MPANRRNCAKFCGESTSLSRNILRDSRKAMASGTKRDKTFRIAQPMRKVSWPKCFAAGGRSVRVRVGTKSTSLRLQYLRIPRKALLEKDLEYPRDV